MLSGFRAQLTFGAFLHRCTQHKYQYFDVLHGRGAQCLKACKRIVHAQAILAALAACPKDADVQRWGCQALVPLFSDPIVATPFRQAGIAAVIRALAVLSCCEAALKSMGAVGGAGGGSGARGGGPKATAAHARWNRAVKKVDLCRSVLVHVAVGPAWCE